MHDFGTSIKKDGICWYVRNIPTTNEASIRAVVLAALTEGILTTYLHIPIVLNAPTIGAGPRKKETSSKRNYWLLVVIARNGEVPWKSYREYCMHSRF